MKLNVKDLKSRVWSISANLNYNFIGVVSNEIYKRAKANPFHLFENLKGKNDVWIRYKKVDFCSYCRNEVTIEKNFISNPCVRLINMMNY